MRHFTREIIVNRNANNCKEKSLHKELCSAYHCGATCSLFLHLKSKIIMEQK